MDSVCTSFAPVSTPDCRVLVLGSMPGVASLRAQAYYAHPRNAFWPVLFGLWDLPADPDYDVRLAFALSRRVAIWDVARTCLREGSSDAAIRDAEPNDFAAFFAAHPGIHTIFHNGRQSMDMFRRLALGAEGRRRRILLPSTSPAYTLPFDDKLAAWRVLRAAAEQEAL